MSYNLSFAGCGFLGIYHVGVASCFKKYAPNLLVDKIAGASAGAIAACALLCDAPLGKVTSDVLRVASQARKKTLGPFSPTFNITKILRSGLEEVLPENAHEIVSGRLHISMTRVCDGQNVIVSQFQSKDDLIQALLCTAFIPIFSGYLPLKFNGTRYCDGGFSDNLPILDEHTITVSPFCGDADICPRDGNTVPLMQINLANTSIEVSRQNLYRFARILFPPEPEVLSKMCQQGFDDALQYLQRNHLISCTRCLSVQSTFALQEEEEPQLDDECEEYDPECGECRSQRQAALLDSLPEAVTTILQDYIDAANSGLLNWVFRRRGAKLISLLTLPYLLPIDIAHATLLRVADVAPKLAGDLVAVAGSVIQYFIWLVQKFNNKRRQFNAKFTCQLAITEYTEIEEIGCVPEDDMTVRNKYHFGFSLDLNRQDEITEQIVTFPDDDSTDMQHEVINMNHQALCHSSSAMEDCRSRAMSSSSVSVPGTPAATAESQEEQQEAALEKVLTMAQQKEAVMSFYYRDSDNKVRVTEIYDVTGDSSMNEGQAWNNFLHQPSHLWEKQELNFTASAGDKPSSDGASNNIVTDVDYGFVRPDTEYFVEGDPMPSGPFLISSTRPYHSHKV